MTTFQLKNQPRAMTFDAMKLDLSNTLQPIRRYLERLKGNNLPLRPGQIADMVEQLDMIDTFLDQLQMVEDAEPVGRARVVSARRMNVLPPTPKRLPPT